MLEEYFRFVVESDTAAVITKQLRHKLIAIETGIGQERMLAARDTRSDCFASENRPEECSRNGIASLVKANFKRGQEAARVLEEYAKLIEAYKASEESKQIRFSLYDLEQQQMEKERHG